MVSSEVLLNSAPVVAKVAAPVIESKIESLPESFGSVIELKIESEVESVGSVIELKIESEVESVGLMFELVIDSLDGNIRKFCFNCWQAISLLSSQS